MSDVYRFIPVLRAKAPGNRRVAETIRQQLQELARLNRIERLERGVYRQNAAAAHAPEWPFHRGDETTRAEIGATLGVSEHALRRGMFKPSKGPSAKRMVLFSDLAKNPYGDRRERGRFVYTGERGQGEGILSGFKAILADHTALGVEVHLFTRGIGRNSIQQYEGQMVVESWREVFRPSTGEKVFEFNLVPIGVHTLGTSIRETYEADLSFHLAQRTRIETVAQRVVRERSFRDALLPAYDHKCAVCGPTLSKERYVDIQAAHILAVSDDGPDSPTNGLALCIRHHWAFDHGIFALSDDLSLVTPDGFVDPHRELRHGAPVRRPAITEWNPLPEYLALHRRKWGFT